MAELVLTNAAVHINSVDLSDHVRSVTINYNAELHDKTAMGDGARARIAGFKDFTMSVEYNQDYAASKVERGEQLFTDFNINKKESWIIGDTIHDYEVAQNLDIECILVADGHQSHKRLKDTGAKVITELKDLTGMLL